MGSSCVNLSRALAAPRRPGLAVVAGRAHGRSVVALSASPRRRADGGAVSCGIANGYVGGSAGVSSGTPSLPVHGKSSAPAPGDHADGLGIGEFLGAKNFLITGGTGFLAKVLIEKILRTNPDVGKIYVLIKAKDNDTALQRLHNEVVDTELFRRLQEIHGEDYHGFIASKLVPVVGDVREANIGIAPELADEIAARVDIIVNSAANTTFDERYDVAMDINTVGPFRIMSFAHRFRRLKLFLQVSTAYVNGQRQGVVLEKPFRLGDTIGKESSGSPDSSSEQQESAVLLDIEAEIKLAFGDSRRHSDDSASFSQEMKDLGLERAKLHGWQDTYVFTKAMGEMVINSMRGEIPVVTIRPSVIESTWRDPFPGWMEGNRCDDGPGCPVLRQRPAQRVPRRSSRRSRRGSGGHGGERDAGDDGEARAGGGGRDARVPRGVVDGEPAGVRRPQPLPLPALHSQPLQRRGGAAHRRAAHAPLRHHGPVRQLRRGGRDAADRQGRRRSLRQRAPLPALPGPLRQVHRADHPPRKHLPAIHLLHRQVRQRQHGGAHSRDVRGGEGGVPLRRAEHRLDGLHHQRAHSGAQEARHEGEGRRRRRRRLCLSTTALLHGHGARRRHHLMKDRSSRTRKMRRRRVH